jgi:hypothetical protein
MVPLNPRFQRKIANAVTALRQGKDDAPGLLLIGPREALDCVRKAPPRLIGVMIDQEMAGREVPLKAGLARPLFDADLLVGATEALHSRLYLALEATGRMTVASFGDRRPQRLNAPAIEQRMIAFRGKIEWQGETSIRLEDFRGLSAAAAGEELGERFWRDVSAEMGNRFLREGFKLARVEDEAKIPLELERGTLEELKDGIRALIGVAIARGEIDAESLRNCDPDRDHIGILTATPASRSLIWLAQGVARGDGVLQVIKEIRRRTKPRLEAVNPQDARGRKIKITGNRVKDQFWIQTCLGAGILEVADGTGHGLMEAENNLRAYLAKTLNIKAERVDALIEGIGPA